MADQTLIGRMAEKFAVTPDEFKRVVKASCGLKEVSDDKFLAFLIVAHEHDLNPMTREIYAFPTRDGGIQAIVGVDGWAKIANRHPQYDGIEFDDQFTEDGKLYAITARVFRKDRQHPTVITEYLKECQRNTDPWRQWPARMLRNKALIQGFRMAFGFAGIMEPDEWERWQEAASAAIPASVSGPLDKVADGLPEQKVADATHQLTRRLRTVAGKDATIPSSKPGTEEPAASSPAPRPLTKEEIKETTEMLDMAKIMDEDRDALLGKYGVKYVKQLTDQQAMALGKELAESLGKAVDEGGVA